jgi:hypothetical protein
VIEVPQARGEDLLVANFASSTLRMLEFGAWTTVGISSSRTSTYTRNTHFATGSG